MSKGYHMSPEHLLEMYQLLQMYQRIYNDNLAGPLIESVTEEYAALTGKNILEASNPRRAGRKPLYDDDKAKEVKAVYEACGSVRQTAKKTGVSTTFIYKCIRK